MRNVSPVVIVPAACLLLQLFAARERLDLPLDLVGQRAAHAADRVHVLDLDLRAQLLSAVSGRTETLQSQRICPFSMSASLTPP